MTEFFHMRRTAHFAVVAAGLFMMSTAASAQNGARGTRRGSDQHDAGIHGAPPQPTTIAALALNHAAELALTDSQRVLVLSIRRAQDSANTPFMLKLDSLKPTRFPTNPNDLSQEQRDEVDARRANITEILTFVNATNTKARFRVLDLLSNDQQRKALDLEEKAKKDAEEQARRIARNGPAPTVEQSGDMGRRRPPED